MGTDFSESETLLREAMGNVVGDYATRIAFAWDRLSITDGGDRMIAAEEMAARVSKVFGLAVSREEFLAVCQAPPEDASVFAALARVLEVDVRWLTNTSRDGAQS